MAHLETIRDRIGARPQPVHSSDHPRRGFDLPIRIHDLPFLDERAKRRILGEDALSLCPIESR